MVLTLHALIRFGGRKVLRSNVQLIKQSTCLCFHVNWLNVKTTLGGFVSVDWSTMTLGRFW
jgi:hypothetical protein